MKPTNCHYDVKRRLSLLQFGDDIVPSDMAGGICWPIEVPPMLGGSQQVQYEGFACMAGLNVDTGVISVYDERPWVTVGNVVDSTGMVTHHGLADWFPKMYQRFFARRLYWNQLDAVGYDYRVEVLRHPMIHPRPELVRIKWGDEDAPLLTLWRLIAEKRIKFEKNLRIWQDVSLAQAGDKATRPALHALMCAIHGLLLHRAIPKSERMAG